MKHITQYILEKFKISKDTKLSSDPDDISTWKEGDILYGTFGYSMTIPVFYKVIKRTNLQFTVVKLSKKIVSGHRNGDFYEVPDDTKLEKDLKGTQYRGRIRKKGKNILKIDDVYCHLWDGEPVYGNDLD